MPGVQLFASVTGAVDPYGFALLSSNYGFHHEQVAFSRLIRAHGVSPSMVTAQLFADAVGQAGRGAWDGALAALDTFAARVGDARADLYRYRVAVAGAFLGAVSADAVASRRAAIAPRIARLAPAQRAELAWLDGTLAVARRDTSALASARLTLRAADRVTAPELDRSLGAFALALAGDQSRAADSLDALEVERAETGSSRYRSDAHPLLTSIDRIAAGRWLIDGAQAARAARLLTWHEGVYFPLRDTRQVNAMVQALATYEQGRAAEALGQTNIARDYYQRFLWQYDAPPAAHRPFTESARKAMMPR
jgi:hypothetical protein